jgi:hypothetical protein
MSNCREIQEKYFNLISAYRRFKSIDMRQKPRIEILELKEIIAKSLRELLEIEYEFGDAIVKFLPITADYSRHVGNNVRIDRLVSSDFFRANQPIEHQKGKIEHRLACLVQFPKDHPFEPASIRSFMRKYKLRFAGLRDLLICQEDYSIGGNEYGVVSFLDNLDMGRGVLLRNKDHWSLKYFGASYVVMNSGKYLFVKNK